MNIKTILIGVLVVPLFALFALNASVGAQTFRTGQTANVSATETVDGSAFMSGTTIDVAGTVNGDLYCAGQTVTITGSVDGDILCAAQTIVLSGTVTGDVRLAGQSVTVGGDVEGSMTVAGQTVALDGSGKVGRDAVLLGQSVTMAGSVARDATIASGTTVINAVIGRNVEAEVDTLTLGSSADVKGSLSYSGPSTLSKSQGASVEGKTTYTERKNERYERTAVGFNLAGAIMGWMMLIISALIFALLFPRELHRTTDLPSSNPAQALLAVAVGLIAGIVVPVSIVLLMITVFGLPFALVVLLGWLLILALSGAFAAYYVGRIVWRSQHNAALTMLVGAAIVATLLAIPILNIFVWLLAVWFGSGVLLIQLRNLAVAPHYDMSPKKVRGRAK